MYLYVVDSSFVLYLVTQEPFRPRRRSTDDELASNRSQSPLLHQFSQLLKKELTPIYESIQTLNNKVSELQNRDPLLQTNSQRRSSRSRRFSSEASVDEGFQNVSCLSQHDWNLASSGIRLYMGNGERKRLVSC